MIESEHADRPTVVGTPDRGRLLMVVTTMNRHLLIQLQTGQTAAGKPKLHNRVYPHVDVEVADDAINQVLEALTPLFADPVYVMGRVDTVQIAPDTSSSASSSTTSSGSTTSSSSSSTTTGTEGSASNATSSSGTQSSASTSSTTTTSAAGTTSA